MLINLNDYGLHERFLQEATLYEGLYIARVTQHHRDTYRIVGRGGELSAGISGKLAYNAGSRDDLPAVGDWVMVDREDASFGSAVIHHLLRRSSLLMRQAAGKESGPQVIAANIDTIFICMSLNADFRAN